MHLKMGNVKVAYLDHTEARMVKLWAEPSTLLPLRDGTSQSFEDIFRWAAKKGAWHTDAEKFRQDEGGVFEEEEDLFVDMWRHVWVPAVEKWDQDKAEHLRRDPMDPQHSQSFFRWVMYLLGHYLTDLKRIHMTQKERSRRDVEALETPASDDPWEAAWGEGVLEEQKSMDVGIDEIGKVVTEIEDREWMTDTLSRIKDARVKAAISVLVKYYNKESTEDLQARLRRAAQMTFPKLKKLVSADPDVAALVQDGMKRLKDEVRPRRRRSVTASVAA